MTERRRGPRRPSNESKSHDRVELPELDELGLRSFSEEYRRLRRQITDKDFASSQAAQSLLRAQLAAVIRAIGVADKQLLSGGSRGTYAYVSLHGLARELAHDLRSFSDQSEMVERVRRDVVQEVLRMLATSLVSDMITTRQNVRGRLPPRAGRWTDRQLRELQDRVARMVSDADAASVPLLTRVLGQR
jgi:hypothetical protein